ncbi:MAG: RNA polymerase sigma factor RpoE [Burkholderiaceae bacterium]|nr:RNA polymerase sigma factor RpoE [Burkholderiaceae bacterium]
MNKEGEIDRQLVQRVQRGENIAFDLLVSKYQRRLFRLVLRLVGDAAEAEDIVQETFIKAYRALPHFRGDSAFYTWLYRIGINTARHFLETRGRRIPALKDLGTEHAETSGDKASQSDGETPESALLARQIAETINQAMDELPQDLRIALALREFDGLSYGEIAQAMACPLGTVRSRIFRAREAIAEKLQPLLEPGIDKRR